MIDIQEVKRGQYCQVKLQGDAIMAGGLVLRVPAGPRVLLKPEYLELATLVNDAANTKKKKAKKADD